MKKEKQKYNTNNNMSKTKTQINNDYYFNYYKKRVIYEEDLPSISEEEFFNMK
jgi:hypothetical protein